MIIITLDSIGHRHSWTASQRAIFIWRGRVRRKGWTCWL